MTIDCKLGLEKGYWVKKTRKEISKIRNKLVNVSESIAPGIKIEVKYTAEEVIDLRGLKRGLKEIDFNNYSSDSGSEKSKVNKLGRVVCEGYVGGVIVLGRGHEVNHKCNEECIFNVNYKPVKEV